MPTKRPRLQTLKPRLQELQSTLPVLGSWRAGKTKTAERGYGGRWQRERAEFLRKNPLCVMCEAEGRTTAATVVDHKVAHRGDEARFWDRSNWQGLCATHHSSDAQRRDNGSAPRVRIGEDGWPTPQGGRGSKDKVDHDP